MRVSLIIFWTYQEFETVQGGSVKKRSLQVNDSDQISISELLFSVTVVNIQYLRVAEEVEGGGVSTSYVIHRSCERLLSIAFVNSNVCYKLSIRV